LSATENIENKIGKERHRIELRQQEFGAYTFSHRAMQLQMHILLWRL
jgi:hypothetical protein